MSQGRIFGSLFCLLTISLISSGLPDHPIAAQESVCSREPEIWSDRLLADLPNYTNRVIRSVQNLERSDIQARYIIVASQPGFDPLPLRQTQYTRVFSEEPTQLFFTTLERRYLQQEVQEIEQYHWLFLVKTEQGWRMFMLLSSLGTSQKQSPPAPPRVSNYSAIGQGIRLWLRDCQTLEDF